MNHRMTSWLAISYLLTSVIIGVDSQQCGSTDIFVNITIPSETVFLFEGSQINTTITVNEVLVDGVLSFTSSDPAKFTVRDGDASTVLATTAALPRNITVVIEGHAISLESLEVRFEPSGSDGGMELGRQTIGIKRVPQIIQAVYIYLLLAWIVLSYLSMGGSMDIKEVWKHIRKPYGILIGLFCQFIIMPALTYLIALLLARGDATTSVGIVLIGTTPGGWLSNIFCALLDVDLVLSITMTFCSTVIALGMMPLNLLIYATPFTAENTRLRTPFADLAQQLALLVIPVFVGVAISWKFPKFKVFCKKVVKPIATILIVIGVGLVIPADYYAFSQSPTNNWVASVIIPLFGAFFGLSFARIFARDIRTSITIALETGVQNALLGRTIVYLFYPQPEADLLARVILTTVLLTLLEGTFIALVYSVIRYLLCKRRCDKKQLDDDDEKAIASVDDIEATAIDENVKNGNVSKPEETEGTENSAYQSESNQDGPKTE